MHIDNILYHAAPALAILLLAEIVYMIIESRHDNKDMLTSIGLALGALPVSFIINGVVLYTYTLIYQLRLFTIPGNYWWAWVILFFGDDLSYYWYHRMSHQVRFLWASHIVHHSSEKFTLSSGLRVPWTSNLTGTFLFWAWMPLIGIEPAMVILMKSVSVIYQFWMHTETIKRLPTWFEAVFNTPSHHRVHHSSDVEYLDKNHAGTLIIWDKLFGTYQPEIFKPKYGLTENIKSFNPFAIAFHEWKNIFSDIKRTKKIKDRVRYFFKPPGWSHDESNKTTKQLQSELRINHAVTNRNKPAITIRKKDAAIKCIAVLLLAAGINISAFNQERKLFYDVIRNGNIIGEISLIELTKYQKKFLSLTSDVKTSFVFSFSIHTSETAAYENGIMVYSSFYEKKTGSGKADKTTIASGTSYKLVDDGVSKLISCNPIRYNMLLLYTNIPEAINKVYSDNFQKHLDIKKVEANKYRLTLPDGNYNYYTYRNGVCSKVDVERTFFTLQFVLREK